MANRTCSILGCERPHAARGWCHHHYIRWRETGTTDDPVLMSSLQCAVDGCDRQARKRGWCELHYWRWRKHGTTDAPSRRKSEMGTVNAEGYAVVKRPEHPLAAKGGLVAVHRVVLFDKIGPGDHACHWCTCPVSWDKSWPRDPDGLVVDHLDHNRLNNDPDNLVPSCEPCNKNRGARGPV